MTDYTAFFDTVAVNGISGLDRELLRNLWFGLPLEDLKRLLRDGADPNLLAGESRPLIAAVRRWGNAAGTKVGILLAHGADPNLADGGGCTALSYAVAPLSRPPIGSHDLIDSIGDPWNVATASQRWNLRLTLHQCPVNRDFVDGCGASVVINPLVRAGARIDVPLGYPGKEREQQAWPGGRVASHLGLVLGQAVKDVFGESDNPKLRPLWGAVGDAIRHGAAPDATDFQGNTLLFYAFHRGLQEDVRMLLEAGADPGHANCFGKTAIDFGYEMKSHLMPWWESYRCIAALSRALPEREARARVRF